MVFISLQLTDQENTFRILKLLSFGNINDQKLSSRKNKAQSPIQKLINNLKALSEQTHELYIV